MKRRLLLACCALLLTAGLGALRFFRLTGGRLPPRSAEGSALPPLVTFAPEFTAAETGALLDLNTADQAALETLPGIGEALAQRILAYRETHGPFSSVDELQAVDGIGPGILARLRPYVTAVPAE